MNENLPKGWVRDESGSLRRETIHSMLRRLPGWNYCQPWIYQLFAEGFQDTILFHEGQLGDMFSYLGDNARRRAVKALYPELFRGVDEIAVTFRLSPCERDEMTRADATVMNRLSQWIVGEGAAEINYHGMRPENVDALAAAAAWVERR